MVRRAIFLVGTVAALLVSMLAHAQQPAPAQQPPPTKQAAPANEPAPVREPAPPQKPAPPADPVKSALGAWEFSNADRDRRCNVVLKEERAAIGMKLDFDPACASVFPFLKEVVGWKVARNGFVLFVGADGKTILDFSEVETGLFETLRVDEGVLFLQTAAEVGPPPKIAAEMAGEWVIMRGNKPICALSLSDKVLGPEALMLNVKPGCNVLVTRFGPVSWQMDRGELVLTSARGETWRFEAADTSDGKTWQRVPEPAVAVLMVKQ